MAVVKITQESFAAGEVSRDMLARVDVDTYSKCAISLKNCLISNTGKAYRRPGLQFIDDLDINYKPRLITFEFNNEQTYLIVFYKDKFVVYRNDVKLAEVGLAFAFEMTEAEVLEFDYTQSADTLIIVHPNNQPFKINRISDTNWQVQAINFESYPRYAFNGVTVSEPPSDIKPSATEGTITITRMAGSDFNSAFVGSYLLINNGTVYVTSLTNVNTLLGRVVTALSTADEAKAGTWQKETGYADVWSSARGWPQSVTFHGGRLWFGGSKSRPQTLWGSKTNDFFKFGPQDATGRDTDPLDITIDDDEINSIRNIFSGRNLQIFTSGGEYYIPTTSSVSKISPETIAIKNATRHGTAPVKPVAVDGSTIFVERGENALQGGYVIREFVFDDVEDSYISPSLSTRAHHLIKAPVRMIVRRGTKSHPEAFVYCVNGDGTLAVLNTLKSEGLLAWTPQETDGLFFDLTVTDRVIYAGVLRTINGQQKYYLEKFDDQYIMDCALKFTSPTLQMQWSGFDHLEGKEVRVRGDGFAFRPETVDGGEISTIEEALELQAGLAFFCKVTPPPPDGDVPRFGRLTGGLRRIVYVNMYLNETSGAIVKRGEKIYRPAYRKLGDNLLDKPVPKFSGWKKVFVEGYDREPTIDITQDETLEFELAAIVTAVTTPGE